jgi:hypothetical protein
MGEMLNIAISTILWRLISAPDPRELPAAFLDEMYDNYDRRARNATSTRKQVAW